jgi:RNase P subunit RPR2
MNNEQLHQDLCPMCHRPLTELPTVVVRSHQSNYPARIDTKPYCEPCDTGDPIRRQEWANMMNARDES